MRKFILMLLLAGLCSSAMAEWVAVVNATDNSFTIYTDYNTISKSDNFAEMWFMDDFETAKKAAGGNLYFSSKEQFRFDCKRKISQTIAYSLHSESMGEGAVVYSDTNTSAWEPIQPGSNMEVFWKGACNKK
jgi:hypothetical protein